MRFCRLGIFGGGAVLGIEANLPIEVPKPIVSYIARQLELSPNSFREYEWQGRTSVRHRVEIREFFGFRESTQQDAQLLKEWLCQSVLIYDCQESHLETIVYQRFRELRLEPPTPDQVKRLIRSAVRTAEAGFCKTLFQQLSSESLVRMDALLSTELIQSQEKPSHFRQSVFSFLKSDPGRAGLESLLKEVEKLKCIRQLGLPPNLFANIPPKIIQHYRRRASAEAPRDLRRHPNPIRYTLVAAFCWQRSQEITDSLVDLLIQIIHRIYINAERRVDKQLVEEFKRVNNKPQLHCNPEEDLPQDFEQKREIYYQALKQPLDASGFITQLYGLGTNTGLKRICAGIDSDNYDDLRYIKKHFINKEDLRNAIAAVVNAIFRTRSESIWGEGTTTCASDSKKFGAWDQNLMTEWHIRYGGRGVMIYWHVEKKSACIYSQLKTCSSSEVAAMIEGLLRHCTDMQVKKNFVDTHGQSEVAFAFCRLLGFELMPRIRRIGEQRLYLPHSAQRQDYPNLQSVLTKAIDWELISQQYDQMIKYATALKLGTAEAESLLRRFNRSSSPLHPTHLALSELGKAVRTIFLCKYLHSEKLRREIQEGLNVVEQWNGANGFIFYGKNSEIATNRLDEQELSVLALHLLQICLVYINTLMIQKVLTESVWEKLLTKEDLRALTPLIWEHINPYGTFRLDMNKRLPLDAA